MRELLAGCNTTGRLSEEDILMLEQQPDNIRREVEELTRGPRQFFDVATHDWY